MSKLDIVQVRPGMIVDEAVYEPKTGQMLLQHGTEITPRMMVALKFHGIKSVSVSIPDSLYIPPSASIASFLQSFFKNKINDLAPENPEGNVNDQMPAIARHSLEVLNQVLGNEDVLNLCVEIKLVNNQKLFYPAIHSCAHAVLVAGAMGMADQELYNVAAATLLQNLGMCDMAYLLNVPERNEDQEALWREHCQYGYYYAKESGISNDICRLILRHHEHFDGSGYPEGLYGDDIPMGSKIINLCANFDDMIFRQKMQPYQVAEHFFSAGDGIYDSRVIDAFIMNIPLYPLGSIVRLSNEEVGVVVNIRKNIGARPIVRVCYNRVNKPYTDSKIVDLGADDTLFIKETLL